MAFNPAEISRSYGLGIVARRWIATWLDFIILGFLSVIFLVPINSLSDDIKMLVFLLTVCTLCFSYYMLLEGITGATVGKFIVGIRVVSYDGTKPTFWQVALRTVLRVLEVNPVLLGCVPAGVVVAMSRGKQRWGDMLANTYVLYNRNVRSLE